jgi:predicted membrane channel-forming protein YqfA (hemolysin III family)
MLAVVGWQLRHTWRQSWLLLLGLLFLSRFVIVRAATFYGVPFPALSQFTNGVRITWMLEILGASAITFSALLTVRRGKLREHA